MLRTIRNRTNLHFLYLYVYPLFIRNTAVLPEVLVCHLAWVCQCCNNCCCRDGPGGSFEYPTNPCPRVLVIETPTFRLWKSLWPIEKSKCTCGTSFLAGCIYWCFGEHRGYKDSHSVRGAVWCTRRRLAACHASRSNELEATPWSCACGWYCAGCVSC